MFLLFHKKPIFEDMIYEHSLIFLKEASTINDINNNNNKSENKPYITLKQFGENILALI